MKHNIDLSLTTLFNPLEGEPEIHKYYRGCVLNLLNKLLPPSFFQQDGTPEETLAKREIILSQVAPLTASSNLDHFPGTFSFFALSKYRSNSFKFFFDMISCWLVPGKRLNVVLVYASDFLLSPGSQEIYTIYEVMLNITNREDIEEIKRTFPLVKEEISLGMSSEFYSQRILESKSISIEDKTSRIQGVIATYVKRFPNIYDFHLFTEMQQLLVSVRDDFKAARRSKHLVRIIIVHYLLRKHLKEVLKKHPKKRNLQLNIFRSRILSPKGEKPVLGVTIGLNLKRGEEFSREKGIQKTIQSCIPGVSVVENSFFINKSGLENAYLCYLEIEKANGQAFSAAEIRILRKELPEKLKGRVEQRMHSVFMPRNEEEILRNMLVLADQIKFLRDPPQVMITFDAQSATHLHYTVILARIANGSIQPIHQLFKTVSTEVEFIPDRVKTVGTLRKRYPKEAAVFHLNLLKQLFIRSDLSIDLYKARQYLIKELTKVFGEVRDYNGGMISKQDELLARIRSTLPDLTEQDSMLLENSFYNLAPLMLRGWMDPLEFNALFLLMSEGLKEYKNEGYFFKLQGEQTERLYAVIIGDDAQIRGRLQRALHELQFLPQELLHVYLQINGCECIGYLCRATEQSKRDLFSNVIAQALVCW